MAYNGWSNYETWAVGMFLDGNYDGEATYLAVVELVDDAYMHLEAGAAKIAELLEEFVRDLTETGDAGLASDLIGAALSEVDWRELAEHQVEDSRERATA